MKKSKVEITLMLNPELARKIIAYNVFTGISPYHIFPMTEQVTLSKTEEFDKWFKRSEKWRTACLKRAIPIEGVDKPSTAWLYKAYV